MIELVFLTCLQTQPTVCEEQALQYVEQITPMACLIQAQPELAKWVMTHPGWTVARWGCRRAETREIRI